LAEIRTLEQRASRSEPVLYVDEVDIHLNPKVGRDWMLPSHQRRLVTPGKNQKFYLAGGLDVLSGKLVTTGLEKKNSDLFIAFLKVLDRRYESARRIHLILDNYKIHSSIRTNAALKAYGDRFVLHFLPPYCPDANRIERVWQDLHANVTRNHRCKTLSALLGRARRFVNAYQWKRVAKSADHELMRAA
jgi:transposase